MAAAWGFTAGGAEAGCVAGKGAGELSFAAGFPSAAPEPVELLTVAPGTGWQSPLPNGQYQLWLHWIVVEAALGGGLIVLTST